MKFVPHIFRMCGRRPQLSPLPCIPRIPWFISEFRLKGGLRVASDEICEDWGDSERGDARKADGAALPRGRWEVSENAGRGENPAKPKLAKTGGLR